MAQQVIAQDTYLIVCASYSLKQALFREACQVLPKISLMPRLTTLDELVTSISGMGSHHNPGLEKVFIRHCLETVIMNCPDLTPFLKNPGFIDILYLFFQDAQFYGLKRPDFLAHHPLGHVVAGQLLYLLETVLEKRGQLPWLNNFQLYQRCTSHDRLAPTLQDKQLLFWGMQTVPYFQQSLLDQITTYAKQSTFFEMALPHHAYFSINAWLINKGITAKAPSAQQDDFALPSISYTACPNLESEIKHIAQHCYTLCVDQQVSPTDIVIIIPDAPAYETALKRCLADYQLPIHDHAPALMEDTPFFFFVCRLFDLVIKGLSADTLLRFFHSPFVHTIMDIDTSQPLPIKPVILSSLLHITSFNSKTHWLKTLKETLSKATQDHLLPQLDADLAQLIKRYDQDVSEQLQVLTCFSHFFEALLACSTLSDLIAHIKTLPQHFTIPDHIQQAPSLQQKHLSLAALVTFDEQCDRFLQLYRVLHIPHGNHRQTLQDLQQFLAETPLIPIPQEGICLYQKNQASFVYAPYIFIPGLIDTFWPQRRADNPCCPHSLREHLHWPNHQTQSQEQHDQFDQFLLQATHTLYLSYPSQLKGAPTCRSHFVDSHHYLGDLVPTPYNDTPHNRPLSKKEWLLSIDHTHFPSHIPSLDHRHMAMNSQSPDGNLSEKALTMAQEQITKTTFSVAQLDRYQSCPYQYFLQYLCQETPLETVSDDISSKLWGTLLHDIFYQFSKARQDKDLSFSVPKHRPKLTALLQEIATTIFDQYADASFYWVIKHLHLFGYQDNPGLLALYIDNESHHPLPLIPTLFEWEFGISKRSRPTHQDRAFTLTDSDKNTLSLRGVIDMVLFSPDNHQVAVLDYKTGRSIPSPSDIKHFRSLQIPLYLLVMKQTYPTRHCVGGIHYQIKDETHFAKHVTICTKETKQDLFDLGRKRPFLLTDDFFSDFKHHLFKLHTLMSGGYFGYDPHPKLAHMDAQRSQSCRFCSYKLSCRYPKRFER